MGAWYRTGTVSVTNGSPDVVGVDTLMESQASVGDIWVGPDLEDYEITAITDDTHWSIKQKNGTAAYAGATASAQPHIVIRNFTSTLPAQLASDLAALMQTYHISMDELTAWLSGTGTVTVHDAVGNAYSVQTPAAMNAILTGRLSKSVAGSGNITLTSAEAANLFHELTGTRTAIGNYIVPASARHYFVYNATGYAMTVKTPAGTGVSVPAGARMIVECDGTNVVNVLSYLNNLTLGGTTKATSLNVGGSDALSDGTAKITNAGAEGIEFYPAYSAGLSETLYFNRSGAAYLTNKQRAGEHQFFVATTKNVGITATGFSCISTTTASAANLYQSASGTELLRSTSSIRYKRDVETLDLQIARKILGLRPVWYRSNSAVDNQAWSYYGLIAEEAAEIEPRLVHWRYRDMKQVLVADAVDAKPAVFDEDGVEIAPAVEAREALYAVEPDTDSPLIPDGVQYERLSVLLLALAQDQETFNSQALALAQDQETFNSQALALIQEQSAQIAGLTARLDAAGL